MGQHVCTQHKAKQNDDTALLRSPLRNEGTTKKKTTDMRVRGRCDSRTAARSKLYEVIRLRIVLLSEASEKLQC